MFCSPAPPQISGSPTLMSGTPILVSGFLSSIFRIKSLSSSLTFGLKRGKEGDEERLLMVRASLYPALPPHPVGATPHLSESRGDTPKARVQERVPAQVHRYPVLLSRK